MTGREGFIAGVVLTLVVVLFVWSTVFKVQGIKAVECVRDPAVMQVEATTDRKGHIVERSIGECTFFSYKGPVSVSTD